MEGALPFWVEKGLELALEVGEQSLHPVEIERGRCEAFAMLREHHLALLLGLDLALKTLDPGRAEE